MRIFLKLLIAGIALGSGIMTASAADQAELSSEKLTIIRQNCVAAQVTLQQVQYSDAATRVNRGQGYENILARMITPLNTRVASNGFNSSATTLTEITTRYQQSLESFKKHYDNYDDALTNALRTKCQEKPGAFYRYLAEARKQRANISGDVNMLSQIIDEYRQAVVKLKGEV